MTDRQDRLFFRRMRDGDLPAVLAIETASFPNPWSENTFRGEIQNSPISEPLVAVHRFDGRVIGYVITWRIRDDVQVNNIAVHPDFRGQGIGETMMKIVMERMKRAGAAFVSLEVRISNVPAQNLYRKLGFEILGIRKAYYAHPPEDALVMGFIFGQ